MSGQVCSAEIVFWHKRDTRTISARRNAKYANGLSIVVLEYGIQALCDSYVRV